MAIKQCRSSAPSVPGKVGRRGQNVHWVLELGAEQPGHKHGPCVHFHGHRTLSFLSSEFSSALENLKLLNSFVDSVGMVTAPFSSSSVLKSALGKHPAGWLSRPWLLSSVLHSCLPEGSRGGYECVLKICSESELCIYSPHVAPSPVTLK